MATQVYLAGPAVLLQDPIALYDAKKQICEGYGLMGVSPLDHLLDLSQLPPKEAGRRIHEANERHMRFCELAIANMTPFRSPSADVGTAYEMGFMRALGKPVLGYTNVAGLLLERTIEFLRGKVRKRKPGEGLEDADQMLIEDFELVDNLMLDGAMHGSGFPVVVIRTREQERFTDLAGFEICVKQAARLVGHGLSRRASIRSMSGEAKAVPS